MAKKIAEPFIPEASPTIDLPLDAGEFTWVGPDPERQEAIARPSISYWRDAMRRLYQNKSAVACIVVLVVIILMSAIVPLVSPYTMSEQHLDHASEGLFYDAGEHFHIFGTDELGRDLFTRVWHGGRTSLIIAFAAVFVNLVIGVVYGSISGYSGGVVDNIMMRILELLNGIPYLMVVILLRTVMSGGVISLIVAYSTVGWVGMARLVRGQIIALKEQEFVVAAKALGAPASRIIARHLIPNLLSVVIINITLAIPSAIFTEAFLSFIGLGVPIPEASWGTLTQDGIRVFQMYPTMLALPAFFISITMLSFNLLGDGLRDAFDPRLRR